MAQGPDDSRTPDDDSSFDQWVSELGGPEAVVAVVEATRRQVADGSLVGFTDKEEFLAHCGAIPAGRRDLAGLRPRRR